MIQYLLFVILLVCIIFALAIDYEYIIMDHYSIIGLIFVCFAVSLLFPKLYYRRNNDISKYEHMTDTEAIQNVASMLKDGMLRVNNIEVSDTITTKKLMTETLTSKGQINAGPLVISGNCSIDGDNTITGKLDVGKRITSEKNNVAHQGDNLHLYHDSGNATCGVRFTKKYTGTCADIDDPSANGVPTSVVRYALV